MNHTCTGADPVKTKGEVAKATCEACREISGKLLGCVNCICVNPCALAVVSVLPTS